MHIAITWGRFIGIAHTDMARSMVMGVGGQHHQHTGFALLGASWERKGSFLGVDKFSRGQMEAFASSTHGCTYLSCRRCNLGGLNDH